MAGRAGRTVTSGAHLVRRFFWSLSPAAPDAAEVAWAHGRLSPAERELWDAQSRQDRRHALRVARRVEGAAGSGASPVGTDQLVAAALLHDVGKTDADLGTLGRVVATSCGFVVGEPRARAWAGGSGWRRRIGRYLTYPSRSVERLEAAGSDPFVVRWAAEHHEPERAWTVDRDAGRLLAAADE